MAYLFIVENGVAKPTTETLLISPYKDIWERDVSEDKSEAIKAFCFIEFMCSKKKTNPYAGYDEEVRFEKLRDIYYSPDWEADELIQKGISDLHEFQTEASPTYSYYLSVLEGASKMKEFFRNFSFNDMTERGVPLYKPRDITSAMTDTDKVLQNMNSMKEKVEQELFEQTKTRSNKTINPFEQ